MTAGRQLRLKIGIPNLGLTDGWSAFSGRSFFLFPLHAPCCLILCLLQAGQRRVEDCKERVKRQRELIGSLQRKERRVRAELCWRLMSTR